MAGMDSTASNLLIRSEVWSTELKDILKDMLQGQQYINWMTNFPDGTTFTIPSIGEIPMRQANEGTAVVYDSLDTGEFQFTIDQYPEAAIHITDKAKQDMYYYNQLVASFVPKMRRAIEENLEGNVFALANSQTLSDPNTINGAPHRFVAHGSTNTTLALEDFAQAKFSLDKAGASQRRIAVIDTSQEFALNTLTNLVNVTNNPRFEGIVTEGFVNSTTGLSFIRNIFGFDVYVSNYLAVPTDGSTINADARGAVALPASPVSNLFMSFGGDESPFKGAWRQALRVESERNKDLRRDEYVMNGRYGLKLYRPETMVTVISKSTI